jgi:hypothetical protein
MMLSDEEVIKRVEAIWATNPYPTRNLMRKKIGCSEQRFEALAARGLIKYPARVPKGKCHLFSNQNKWRAFKLKGSPKRREV